MLFGTAIPQKITPSAGVAVAVVLETLSSSSTGEVELRATTCESVYATEAVAYTCWPVKIVEVGAGCPQFGHDPGTVYVVHISSPSKRSSRPTFPVAVVVAGAIIGVVVLPGAIEP